ncbi:MAG TPA: zinc ABC transporter substrate-binding protein [Epulopiscium sp.]|nr:zinc ABC transporter substrate-binding protein [Candidatus Epulonipiscium sp.]
MQNLINAVNVKLMGLGMAAGLSSKDNAEEFIDKMEKLKEIREMLKTMQEG